MPLVWFIRHGQSSSNAGLPTTVPEATPLTDLGRAQALVAAGLLGQRPEALVHSPFARARQTAQPAMERFPDCPVLEWPAQEYTYLAPEKYRGTTTLDRRPQVKAYWKRCDPDYVDGPGAESFAGFMARVGKVLEDLAGFNGFVPVYCHGQFMRAVIWLLMTSIRCFDAQAMSMFSNFRRSIAIPNCAYFPVHFSVDEPPLFGGIRMDHLEDELLTG